MQYWATAQTDIGIAKQVNQDSLTVKIAETPIGDIVLAVICDGMGGLKLGEVASASVITTFQDWFYRELSELIRNELSEELLREVFMDMVSRENEKIMLYGKQENITLGTTLTAALILRDKYYVIHVGDCRLYEITDELKQLTKDQTYVAREIELGRMTEAQAQVDNQRNVLLQCIGVNAKVEPVFFSGNVKKDATYLLCSDGFRHQITENEIYEFCCPNHNVDSISMQKNIQHLIEVNKSRQERDNISAILIRSME